MLQRSGHDPRRHLRGQHRPIRTRRRTGRAAAAGRLPCARARKSLVVRPSDPPSLSAPASHVDHAIRRLMRGWGCAGAEHRAGSRSPISGAGCAG